MPLPSNILYNIIQSDRLLSLFSVEFKQYMQQSRQRYKVKIKVFGYGTFGEGEWENGYVFGQVKDNTEREWNR